MKRICFIDTEVSIANGKVYDYGAVNHTGNCIHTGSYQDFSSFISEEEYVCGHNIIEHDLMYTNIPADKKIIDTLFWSALLFPKRPSHALLKDEKLNTDELNNPLNDSFKSKELFWDEINAFKRLDEDLKIIYYLLLNDDNRFKYFFSFLNYSVWEDVEEIIRIRLKGKICDNISLNSIIKKFPIELAYSIAYICENEDRSIIPRWIMFRFPHVENILNLLKKSSCGECNYCKNYISPKKYLKKYFGYDQFREYEGEPLQENAVNAAFNGKSLLAIFPTGGGKSLTFQVPALMAGELVNGLTVIISPLQSLMKDQVDNLVKRGITGAVAINGLLSPLERAEAIEMVASGVASILYISPESLRSATIERLILSRNIDRIVIDEAHCFSAWGQDFRVDYLYIGCFIKNISEKKMNGRIIPVSCFTATAKQKVISDIKVYFEDKLGIELELFATNATRTNLKYEVLYKENDDEKYNTLRMLLEQKKCPAIVYVSRTKTTVRLAEKLKKDGFSALPYNGSMESDEKRKYQEDFINDKVQIMVATSAFGMGVDKPDVGLVVHYEISDSLENYVQEAGRAGRDPQLSAQCYVLFNDEDLNKHFMLLNQTKLSISEIQQVWKVIKNITRNRNTVVCSAFELGRWAGWDESVKDIETRVKTAVLALENSGYIKRGKNVPHIYATSILVKDMAQAAKKIDSSNRFVDEKERQDAKRIMSLLISSKNTKESKGSEAESRVDYISDILGIEKKDVMHVVELLREESILADEKDLTAYIKKSLNENKSINIFKMYRELELYILDNLVDGDICFNYKELNEGAVKSGIKNSSVNAIKTILYYWNLKGFIKKEIDPDTNKIIVSLKDNIERFKSHRYSNYHLAKFIIHYLYLRYTEKTTYYENDSKEKEEVLVGFSVKELLDEYKNNYLINIISDDVEEALLYISKIDAIKLDGGFFVIYSAITIERLITDNKIRYKVDDYKQLNDYYQQKIQQIHIVGEFANMMVRDYEKSLMFVKDYFQMEYRQFLNKYFSADRLEDLNRNITPLKYKKLFDELSNSQLKIINDSNSKYIGVFAGPGSGKTKVLVHKLASLLLMEDIKHEQLLMLTFSRAAAMEFRHRLHELIGNAAYFVEIKTFHSYCFDLLGKIGNIKESENVVADAAKYISDNKVDVGRITKSVLVIDEAQDMDLNEYNLIEVLIEKNEDMRIIAVGDDDQNIYGFRGSDSKYFKKLMDDHNATKYYLLDNYRSANSIVKFSNNFAKEISCRMKSEEIVPVKKEEGVVKLIKHNCNNYADSIIDDVMKCNNGSVCVLTHTNKEALIMLAALKNRGIKAKLIQSMDGFDIYNIAEIRYFLKCINISKDNNSPLIDEKCWFNAVEKLKNTYQRSACLPLILEILKTYENEYEKKYRTDFEEYLHESKVEHFYKNKQGVVTVSTMHKSKGREFDNVIILLDDYEVKNDEEKRLLYVAFTRAKGSLHLHYLNDYYDKFSGIATSYFNDKKEYPIPKSLVMQLTHKDIWLDYFKGKENVTQRLLSGTKLEVIGNRLYYCNGQNKIPVVQFSSSCYKEIKSINSMGYKAKEAVIRYICGWCGKNDEKETVIILADVFFSL